jgi:hypothetical protein
MSVLECTADHARAMVGALQRLPGYADDLARWAVTLAKKAAEPVSIVYEGIEMKAEPGSCPHELARHHQAALSRRHSSRWDLKLGNEVPGPQLLSLAERRRLTPPRNDWLGDAAIA